VYRSVPTAHGLRLGFLAVACGIAVAVVACAESPTGTVPTDMRSDGGYYLPDSTGGSMCEPFICEPLNGADSAMVEWVLSQYNTTVDECFFQYRDMWVLYQTGRLKKVGMSGGLGRTYGNRLGVYNHATRNAYIRSDVFATWEWMKTVIPHEVQHSRGRGIAQDSIAALYGMPPEPDFVATQTADQCLTGLPSYSRTAHEHTVN
jgi:hypothetical protein